MSLQSAFADLTGGCQLLRAELRTLGLTLGEDAPAKLAVIDRLEQAVADLDGRAEESYCKALRANDAAERLDLLGAQRQLAAAQVALVALTERFRDDLVSYDALGPVAALRRRRGDWPAWVHVVRQGIDRCRPRITAIHEAHCRCWQELTDRATVGPVYVHTSGRTA